MATILVTNASGLQGKAVAEELQKANFEVRVLTRNKNKLALPGYEVAEGSFDDIESLKNALKGVAGVYFKVPLIFERDLLLQYTKNFIEAAKTAQIKTVVFNSSIFVPEEETGFLALDVKLEIENLLRASGLPVIYLRPRIYLDNLAAPWSVPVLLEQGILPVSVPQDQKVSWISLYDLARYTVAAFQKPELAGRTFEIGAPSVTGKEIATGLSELLDKEITYVYVNPDDFENALREPFGDLSAKSIAGIYRYLRDNPEDFEVNSESSSVLGIQPLELKQWLANVPWKQLHGEYTRKIVTAE